MESRTKKVKVCKMSEEKEGKAFISYSTHNQDIAFKVCDYLEEAGIACWIAPRNVVAGANYAGQIVSAIRNCDAFILIASNAINESGHVSNEVSIAFDAKKDIIPFKIEETEFSDEYLYFLGRKHWIDAHIDIEEGLKLLKSSLLYVSNGGTNYNNNFENKSSKEKAASGRQSENAMSLEEDYNVVSPQEFRKYGITLEKVRGQLENIIADFQEKFDTKQSGLKEGLKILDLLGDDWRIILDQENQVAGYWVFIALNDESFEKAKQGIFDEKDISLENIDFIDLPGEYNGYLWMMGTNPKKWTTKLQMLLVQSLIEYIEDNAQRGLFFSSICSLAESRQSISIRTKIGLKVIAEHFNGGEICFLDMRSIKNNNFFAKYGKLVECYEDYFGNAEA